MRSAYTFLIAKPERRFKSVESITKLFVSTISFGSSPMACGPTRAMASSFLRFLGHTQRRTTVSKTPLAERSALHRDLCLTTHNTHDRHTCPPERFELTVSAGERQQTHALDRAANGADWSHYRYTILNWSIRLLAFRL
jgi:hypothetical protein